MNSTYKAKRSAGLVCLPFSLAELRQRWHVMQSHQQVRQQDDDQCHHSNARRIKDKAYEHTSLLHYTEPVTSHTLNCHITFPPFFHPSHLVDKPLVQLFSRVQHESILLRALLALRHQRGVLVSLKQSWNLQQQYTSVSVGTSNIK